MTKSIPKRKKHLSAEERYEILRAISFRIRDTFDLDQILNHLLDTVRTIIDYDAAGIFVLSQDVIHTPYHAPTRIIAGIVQRGFDERPPETDMMLTHGKGIIGHVIETGENVVIPDVRRDPRYVMGRRKTLSEIAVPIFRNGTPIGALNLESDRASAFGHDDLEILHFLADAVSLSIEKALQHVQILEKKRIEDQLAIAREVQERLLPEAPPRLQGYDIAGICLPTHEIGGDYFDFLPLGKKSLGIVVADVSGNGIPAALLMMAFRALLLTNAPSRCDPSEIMGIMNRYMPEFTRRRDFITAVYGILDGKNHTFMFSNAGHFPPYVVHSDGKLDSLEPVGPGLNIIGGGQYQTGNIIMGKGDILVLYTDGIIETFNTRGEDFGMDRLAHEIREARNLTAKGVIERIVKATQEFSGSKIPSDDFTVVVVKRLPVE